MVAVVCSQGSSKIQKELEDTFEQRTGEHTSLEQPEIKKEESCATLLHTNLGANLLVIIKDKSTDYRRYVIPLQGKLDQIVTNGPVGIFQVKPRDYNLPLI